MARQPIALTINGEAVEAFVEPRTHLADFLREERRLTGTHLGCEHGVCGACTVLIDGKPARSCITFAAGCNGRDVRTIEGFEDDAPMARLRSAFTEHHALQCGFCTPGMLITARDITQRLATADEQRIRVELSGNLCRCTGYVGIVKAVKSVIEAQGRAAANEELAAAPSAAAAVMPSFKPAAATSAPTAAAASASAEPAEAGDRKGWTRIEDRFTVPHPPAAVWKALGDLGVAASCLPGAELTEHDERAAKGRIRIKFGPMSAQFAGAATLERNDAAMSAVFRGAGVDSLSSSRARGDIAYSVHPEAGGASSRVDVVMDYSLVGPLAQFSRSGLVRDFASRLIAEFGRNLAARIGAGSAAAAAGTTAPPPAAVPLAGDRMLLAVLWMRIKRFLGLSR
jgi:carbon-monoxide dehydrogenase small subunit